MGVRVSPPNTLEDCRQMLKRANHVFADGSELEADLYRLLWHPSAMAGNPSVVWTYPRKYRHKFASPRHAIETRKLEQPCICLVASSAGRCFGKRKCLEGVYLSAKLKLPGVRRWQVMMRTVPGARSYVSLPRRA